MQPTSLEKKNINSIDLAKLICAVLVVTIHVEPFGETDSDQIEVATLNFLVQHYLARIAVPFFFVASGFLLYRKTNYETFEMKNSCRYLKRLVRLYIVWTVIYFPLALPGILNSGDMRVQATRGYIKGIFITGSAAHLWYFPALILAVFLVSFLLSKKVSPLAILIVSAGFYFFGLFAQSWYGFILPLKQLAPEVWNLLTEFMSIIETTRDGLFDGFFFVSIGMYIAFSDIQIKPRKAMLLFILSMLALLIEVLLLKQFGFMREHDMYLFLGPAVYYLFCFLIKIDLPDNPIYRTMRSLSSLIFYIHVWVLFVVIKALNSVPVHLVGCAPFVITLLVTVVLSYSIVRLSEYNAFRWLKVIYT